MEKFIYYGTVIGAVLYGVFWICALLFMDAPPFITLPALVVGIIVFGIGAKIAYEQVKNTKEEGKEYDNLKY